MKVQIKQTAVEWLVQEFKEKLIGNNLPNSVDSIINEAKAMEKEQSHAEYMRGWKDGLTKHESI